MSRLHKAVMAALAVSVAWNQVGHAQEQPDSGPVEFYACQWLDGEGPGSMEKLDKQFNRWADKNSPGYSAWVALPQFATDLDYDFLWIGSWPDGKTMGRETDAWLTNGATGDMGDAFNEVMDCSTGHVLMTSVAINANDWQPKSGNVWFSACTLAEGKTGMDAISAHSKVAATLAQMGIKSSSWSMYPALGMAQMDYDYLQVVFHDSYAQLGNNYDLYYSGGGVQKANAIVDGVTSCKSPNLFDAQLIRAGEVE